MNFRETLFNHLRPLNCISSPELSPQLQTQMPTQDVQKDLRHLVHEPCLSQPWTAPSGAQDTNHRVTPSSLLLSIKRVSKSSLLSTGINMFLGSQTSGFSAPSPLTAWTDQCFHFLRALLPSAVCSPCDKVGLLKLFESCLFEIVQGHPKYIRKKLCILSMTSRTHTGLAHLCPRPLPALSPPSPQPWLLTPVTLATRLLLELAEHVSDLGPLSLLFLCKQASPSLPWVSTQTLGRPDHGAHSTFRGPAQGFPSGTVAGLWPPACGQETRRSSCSAHG